MSETPELPNFEIPPATPKEKPPVKRSLVEETRRVLEGIDPAPITTIEDVNEELQTKETKPIKTGHGAVTKSVRPKPKKTNFNLKGNTNFHFGKWQEENEK